MTEVVTSIDIAAPPARVWELALDPAHLRDWVTIHRSLHSHDDGPPRTGYEMEQSLALRGVTFKVRWKLVKFEPCVHAEWEGRGPARSRAETGYRLAAHDGGTRFHYRNEFRAPLGPLGAIAGRALVGGLPEREANASLRMLKALAERAH